MIVFVVLRHYEIPRNKLCMFYTENNNVWSSLIFIFFKKIIDFLIIPENTNNSLFVFVPYQ